MSAPEIFSLTAQERASTLWRKIEDELTKRLQQQRSKNDNADNTEQQTAKIRGHIECLKGLIALGQEPPVIPD